VRTVCVWLRAGETACLASAAKERAGILPACGVGMQRCGGSASLLCLLPVFVKENGTCLSTCCTALLPAAWTCCFASCLWHPTHIPPCLAERRGTWAVAARMENGRHAGICGRRLQRRRSALRNHKARRTLAGRLACRPALRKPGCLRTSRHLSALRRAANLCACLCRESAHLQGGSTVHLRGCWRGAAALRRRGRAATRGGHCSLWKAHYSAPLDLCLPAVLLAPPAVLATLQHGAATMRRDRWVYPACRCGGKGICGCGASRR